MFEVHYSTLHDTRAVGSYRRVTSAKRIAQTSVVDMAIHFCQPRATWGERLGHADYKAHGYISFTHRLWTNAMNEISPVALEKLFRPVPGSSGEIVMLQPGQKPVNWAMDVVSKLCKAGGLAEDNCAGTLATAKGSS